MDRLTRLFTNPRAIRTTSAASARPKLELLEDRLQPDAGPASLGTAAPFALLAINGGSLSMRGNNEVFGDVGIGANASGRFQRADVHGTMVVDPNADRGTPRVRPTSEISGGIVIRSLSQAVADANAASIADAALTPTLVLGRVTDSMTVTGNGGSNVIRLNSLNYRNDTLTIQGGASDTFVFNVSGDFDFARSKIMLSGGVTANHVLFNFTGNRPTVNLSHESSVINGTFLAPNRTVDVDNAGLFNGAIIAQDISISGRGDLMGTPYSLPMGQLASLSGSLRLLNRDGTDRGPIVGETVELFNSNWELVATAITDENGNYQFTGLAEGIYHLRTDAAASFPGTIDGEESGVGGLEDSNMITDIVLGAGKAGINYNFVEYFTSGG